MKTVSQIEAEVGKFESMIAEAKTLGAIGKSDEWALFRRELDARISGKVERLCATDCAPKETDEIRAAIHELRWFLRIPQIRESELRQAVDGLAALRKMLDRMKMVGVGQSDTTEATSRAETIRKSLQGTS